MVDMGQADSSLYRKAASSQHDVCWTWALSAAARDMGYDHFMDVPDAQVENLKATARRIQKSKH